MSCMKFGVLGTAALAVSLFGTSAQAEPMVITPGQATDRVVSVQQAAPTRHFGVEKAVTLPPGQSRFGANLQVGGLGIGGAAPGIAGGVNLRADMNVSPGLEAGISATGLGGAGVANLLGDLGLRGKLAMTEFSIGATPVEVGAVANIGGFLTGGGLTSGSIGVGMPMTAVPMNNMSITVSPGVGLGFSAGGMLPGGAPPSLGMSGISPTVGLGLDLGLTDRLSAIVDGTLGWTGGFGGTGNLGLRYGINDALAADLFLGYKGNPLTGGLNTSTLGLGGFYAF